MSFELINSLASVATFGVIAASAIAALIQLRHLRTSNQIALLTKLQEIFASADFVDARRFIAYELADVLEDPETAEIIRTPPFAGRMRALGVLGNFYEGMGQFVRYGMLDREILYESWGGIIVQTWEQLAPALAIMRDQPGGDDIWENFEFLAVVSQDWLARHPGGNYPKGYRRMALPAIADARHRQDSVSHLQQETLRQA